MQSAHTTLWERARDTFPYPLTKRAKQWGNLEREPAKFSIFGQAYSAEVGNILEHPLVAKVTIWCHNSPHGLFANATITVYYRHARSERNKMLLQGGTDAYLGHFDAEQGTWHFELDD